MGVKHAAAGALLVSLFSTGCNALIGLDHLGEGGSGGHDAGSSSASAGTGGAPGIDPRVEVVTGNVSTPALAAGENGFALAWTTTTNQAAQTGEVQAVRLNRDGTMAAKPITISNMQGTAQGTPRLAGSGKGYAATWFTRYDYPGVNINKWGVALVMLSANVDLLPGIVTQPSPAGDPSLIWDGNDWTFCWSDATYSNWELSLQKFGVGMMPLFPQKLRVTMSSGSDFQPSLAALGDRTAVAWYEREEPLLQRHVRLTIRTNFGATSGPTINVTDSPDDDYAGVQIAAGKTTFSVSWLTRHTVNGGGYEHTAYVRTFKLDGTPLGIGPVPLTNASPFFAPAQMYFDGNKYGVVWAQPSEIKVARVSEAGAIEDISVLVKGLTTPPEGVAVAWGTDRLALAWREGKSPAPQRIVVQVVPIPGT